MEPVQPDKLRKYIVEYIILALCSCVVFLFLQFNDLNKYIRSQFLQDRNEMIKVIERNTQAIELSNIKKQQ